MFKRMISTLFVVVMLLLLAPVISATGNDSENIEIDFKDFVAQAKQQGFWDQLPDEITYSGAAIKRIGVKYPQEMPAEEIEAYHALCAWQERNLQWSFDKDLMDIESKNGNMLFLSNDEDLEWGLLSNSYFLNHWDNRSNLALTLTVDKAGYYQMNMDYVAQGVKSIDWPAYGYIAAGGGFVDVYVNDELIVDDFSFKADSGMEDTLHTVNLASVYLRSGENSIILKKIDSYHGTDVQYSGRSNSAITRLVFSNYSAGERIPISSLSIKEWPEDLNVGETFQLDVEVEPKEHQNVQLIWSSRDPAVASVDNNGLVTANSAGDTEIYVRTVSGEFSALACVSVVNEDVMIAPYENIAFSFANQGYDIQLAFFQSAFGGVGGRWEYIWNEDAGQKGVCGGMVVSAMLFQKGYRDPLDYGGENVQGLSAYSGRVMNLIKYGQIVQLNSRFEKEKKNNSTSGSGASDKSAQAVTKLAEYAQKDLLYISEYVGGTAPFSHALLANGIDLDSEYNGRPCAKLNVYNCNSPKDKNQYIALYKDENGNYTGEWAHVQFSEESWYNSNCDDAKLSFVTYETIIKALEDGRISAFSLDSEPVYVTLLKNGTEVKLMNSAGETKWVAEGKLLSDDIQGALYFESFYSENGTYRLMLPDDKYSLAGSGTDQIVEIVLRTDTDSIGVSVVDTAELTFNLRDASAESLMADNFMNVDNLGTSATYAITYMPAEQYGYSYDSVTIEGETSDIVETYEIEGNIYISGEDAFMATATVGNETIIVNVDELDENKVYCVVIDETTIQIFCEDAEITEREELPVRQKALLPEYDLESGLYVQNQTLTLQYPNESTNLYYTTDGSDPVADVELLYTTPIAINDTMTVKVLATQYGCMDSDLLELSYEITGFDVAGSNATLGNELVVNIMVKQADITAEGLTAYLTHHAEAGDLVTEIAQEDWTVYGSYYKFSLPVTAAQMTDLVSIEIKDADGNVYNNAYSTSIRGYVERTIDSFDDVIKTLMVDMLNYGASAQQHFGYREEDLANAILTEEQKTLATEEVACTDLRVTGDNYVGSTLSLQDRILLKLVFNGITDASGMTAQVSFTDVLGEAQSHGAELEQYGSRGYAVTVDQIVLADASQLVTVTVNHADGSVHAVASDSVESYIARMSGGDTYGLHANIMKFAKAALAYAQSR